MPKTPVVMFKDADGSVPILDWFGHLPRKAQDKCLVRIERLKELGHELRRPEADTLRDGIYELRAKHQNVNLRMLYFFHGQRAIVLSHGIAKQQTAVPDKDIETAIERKALFTANPDRHTHKE